MQTIARTQKSAGHPYWMPTTTDFSNTIQIYPDGSGNYILVEVNDALQSPLPSGVTNAPQWTTPDSIFDVASHTTRAIESVTTTPFTINRNMIGMNIGPNAVGSLNFSKVGFVRNMDAGTHWRDIELTAGAYNAAAVAKLDAQVAAANAAGCQFIYCVDYPPASRSRYTNTARWLPGTTPSTPGTADYTPLTTFVNYILNRYGSQITAIEGWNEPGVTGSYLDSTGAAGLKTYNDTINTAIATWNSGNSGSVKMVGITNSNWDGISSQTYSNANLAAVSAFANCDVLGYHIYAGGGAAPLSVPRDLIRVVRARMVTDGISAKELWITEFGDSKILTVGNTSAFWKRLILYWLALGAKKIAPYSWDNASNGDMRVSQVSTAFYQACDDLIGKTISWVNVIQGGRIAASINGVATLI